LEHDTDKLAERQATIFLETTNLATELDEEELNKIGTYVVSIYEEDLDSRSDWAERNDKWLKLATQVMETKDYPWAGASNVKYPLLATAALNFQARAYPALIPDNKVVKTRVFGEDLDGKKKARADRVSMHMSYQVLEEDLDWQEDMDRLLYILPIVGLCYKKSYYDATLGRNKATLVGPDDLVINYHAESYERAIKSHRIYYNSNEVHERVTSEYFLDIDLQDPQALNMEHEGVEDEMIGLTIPDRDIANDAAFNDIPYEFIEQHTWYDIDGDGYKEPYIITVERSSRKVVRISARYDTKGITQTPDGSIVKIIPTEYFTLYGFLPNPESKIYYQGFGALLGPINAASNTILNQLIDAGHISNMQSGFLGKGIRLKGGKLRFRPGEWKTVNSTGDDIRKNVYALPVREPSSVLFNLLGMLIDAGEKLSSVKDIMAGENPGQNQPYATTVAVLEQGMKVFVGIYKRIYRALHSEFRKQYRLNSIYLNEDKYIALLDADEATAIGPEDYSTEDLNIAPAADPSIVSESHKMMKAESLLQKKMAGLPINTAEVTRRVLEVEGHERLETLLQPDPPPPPNPEIELKAEELEMKERQFQAELQLKTMNTQFEAFKDYAQAMGHMAKAAATESNVKAEEFVNLAQIAKDEYQSITARMKVMQEGMMKDFDDDDKAADKEEAQQKEMMAQQGV